jgi:hypothetical protein
MDQVLPVVRDDPGALGGVRFDNRHSTASFVGYRAAACGRSPALPGESPNVVGQGEL